MFRSRVLRFVAPMAAMVVLAAGAAVVIPELVGSDEIRLAGTSVEGLDEARVRTLVAQLAPTLAATEVVIDSGEGQVRSDAASLGVRLDEEATVAAVLAAESGDVRLVTAVDPEATQRTVAELDVGRTPVTEPNLTTSGDDVVVVPGVSGNGLPADDVLGELQAADWTPGDPLEIGVEARVLEPRFGPADAEAVAAQARAATAQAIVVAAGEVPVTVEPARLRSWVRAAPGDTALELAVDEAKVDAELRQLLVGADTAPTNARFDVVDGVPVVVPGEPGRTCCAPGAAAAVLQALRAGDRGPVALPLQETAPGETTEALTALGIREEVGSFTTRHNAGEPRVKNIHRVADIMRGYIIRPGETLSMNGVLGQRTLEKGYVAAGAIVNGTFKDEVGGGISQFMTTIFNAAFFAGLDYGEHRAHSIYISRYPKGREATINWPDLDLQIRNTTPYAVMVWPTYTETQITVTLYSTKVFASVEQTGSSSSPSGATCESVTVERTRTRLDGSTSTDTFRTLYRREGLNCDGTRTDGSIPTTTTTTTVVPPPTTPPATTVPPPGSTAPPGSTPPPATDPAATSTTQAPPSTAPPPTEAPATTAAPG